MPKDIVTLRKANIEDLELLKNWDEEPHVIASDPNDDWQWETELPKDYEWREQLMIEVNGSPIGYLEIIDPAEEIEHYWGDIGPNLRAIDIWIGEKDKLGKGYGSQAMNLALKKCFAPKDVTGVLVDPLSSNKRAHNFYKKCGFKFLEERTFNKDHCHVYKFCRMDWELNQTI